VPRFEERPWRVSFGRVPERPFMPRCPRPGKLPFAGMSAMCAPASRIAVLRAGPPLDEFVEPGPCRRQFLGPLGSQLALGLLDKLGAANLDVAGVDQRLARPPENAFHDHDGGPDSIDGAVSFQLRDERPDRLFDRVQKLLSACLLDACRR
jgi:hypothetical protein